ncbi:cytochrome c5 [Ancylobacter sp. 3268]|uniref:Isoquinoline 1-oxidoreductase subunit n=1 Tax=Ancylobacter sp. 3268 TaxID=2817752 RepID=UPI002863E846|nr:Isoquinoline 1-oxidoreductase subunit [Ancylobacter sp. 3268]MDR6950918.1 cytochrome c5 [Ancylobacter sp. 3268]
MMVREWRLPALMMAAVLASAAATGFSGAGISATGAGTLAAPADFAHIADPKARSAAYFTELGKVLTNPRCTNCHPATERPRQGDEARLHQPPVFRGLDGFGLDSMRCGSCHRRANFDPARMPGHEAWHLAPPEMAWEGKTVSQICEQIKDPKRNGNRTLADLIEHIGKDTLVGWAWHPGPGRTPVPGTQAQAGALVEAWAESGAACP